MNLTPFRATIALVALALLAILQNQAHAQTVYPIYQPGSHATYPSHQPHTQVVFVPRHPIAHVTVLVPSDLGTERGSVSYRVNGQLQPRHVEGTHRVYHHHGQGLLFQYHDGSYYPNGTPHRSAYRANHGVHSFGVSPAGYLYMYRGEPKPSMPNYHLPVYPHTPYYHVPTHPVMPNHHTPTYVLPAAPVAGHNTPNAEGLHHPTPGR